ncbi:MAG: 1-acyl-sn-glycerol-3-phosphate acyltransferase [Anaeroplasmataceae bacterium]|nr:1-acyl-sn-glycerol-3-phosphate acyltransferase [Anaeroplasmataceae bacterium]MDE6414350.1 1-acyl-sn-glycerol-3-phosphate acyltransferase [Anaeroplasmataceae bacterium]
MQKTIFYQDELNDDFSGIKRKPIKIDETYKYKRSLMWRILASLLYTIIMKPIAYIYMKLRFSFQIENKKILKKYRRSGYFMYANHTHVPADGFMPSLICFPKRVHVVVSSENLSVKGTRNFMAMIGAIPIPNHLNGMRNFKNYIHELIEKRSVIMIYPEAHIWPYYTKIRPFGKVSFTYPYLENAPTFTFTVTYHKKHHRTKIIAYVDGPFYPKKSLNKADSIEDLRNQAYEAMTKRSKLSSFEKIKYIKKECEMK